MGKLSLSRKNIFLMSVLAGFFSIFTLATISTIPISNANALTCSQVEASSNGQCNQDIDQLDDCRTGTASTRPNCVATQSVLVQNNLRSAEKAEIGLHLEQLLDCDGVDNNCIAPLSSNPNPTFGLSAGINQGFSLNTGNQKVDVKSLGSSIVNFDFEGDLHQTNLADGQDRFDILNDGNQEFLITASETSNVNVGGDGEAKFDLDQTNDLCDDARCENTADQKYDIRATGTSTIDARGHTGFAAVQENNGCDDTDPEDSGGSAFYSVACLNTADQSLLISTSGVSTTDKTSVFYDTIGIDDSTGDGQNTAVQTNNCDDFAANEDVQGSRNDDCTNTITQQAVLTASGRSDVSFDNMVSDGQQENNCDVDFRCVNGAQVLFSVLATGNADVSGTGTQVVDQYNECNTRADCTNDAIMEVGIGFNPDGTLNAVNGESDLYTEFSQAVDQANYCDTGASCKNEVDMEYFVTARDGADVNSISNQEVTQATYCSGTQICVNDAEMSNHVFASGLNTELDGSSSQSLTQICDGSQLEATDTCLNDNNIHVDTQALSNALLTYTTSQTFTNTNTDNQGDAYIGIGQTGGDRTFTVSQSGDLPQTTLRGNTPPGPHP